MVFVLQIIFCWSLSLPSLPFFNASFLHGTLGYLFVSFHPIKFWFFLHDICTSKSNGYIYIIPIYWDDGFCFFILSFKVCVRKIFAIHMKRVCSIQYTLMSQQLLSIFKRNFKMIDKSFLLGNAKPEQNIQMISFYQFEFLLL